MPGAYMSVDPVQDALGPFGIDKWDPLGKAPYAVVRRLVLVQLRVGISVVVDAVNPFESGRSDYRQLALEHSAACVVVHTMCSDETIHREGVSSRHRAGNPVDWVEVERQAGYYETPTTVDVLLDAVHPVEVNVASLMAQLR
jgi:predicted kinase